MKHNKEEQEKLAKDIAIAQNKLSDTTQAINREKQSLEDAEKDTKTALKAREIAIQELESIKNKIQEEKQAFAMLKDEHSVAINNMRLEEKEKKSHIDKLDATIDKLATTHKKVSDDYVAYISKIESDKKKQELIIDSTKQYSDKLQKENDLIKSENADLLVQKKNLNVELDSLSVKLSDRYEKLHDVEKQIQNLEDHLYTLSNNKIELENILKSMQAIRAWHQDTIDLLVKQISTLERELDWLEEEKRNRTEQKFQLQRDIQALNQREEFIKNKYQIAGVPY